MYLSYFNYYPRDIPSSYIVKEFEIDGIHIIQLKGELKESRRDSSNTMHSKFYKTIEDLVENSPLVNGDRKRVYQEWYGNYGVYIAPPTPVVKKAATAKNRNIMI